jgi:putative peptidoglycan lipid II flippase
MAPRILGLSFSEINKFIILFLTGSMSLGTLPALTAALRIIIMPQGILGQAMGIAAFPTLATLAAQSAHAEMRKILSDSLRLLLFLGLPVSVMLIMLGKPLITLLFQRGMFDAQSTELVTWALIFLALGLVALIGLEVIARAFYALSDTLTPVLAGGAQVLLMGLLSLWFSRTVFPALDWIPVGGLALGFSLSNYLEVGVLIWLLRRKLGGLNGWHLLDGLWRISLAAFLMSFTVHLASGLLHQSSVWWQAALGTLTGGVAYVTMCAILKVDELSQLVTYGKARLLGGRDREPK